VRRPSRAAAISLLAASITTACAPSEQATPIRLAEAIEQGQQTVLQVANLIIDRPTDPEFVSNGWACGHPDLGLKGAGIGLDLAAGVADDERVARAVDFLLAEGFEVVVASDSEEPGARIITGTKDESRITVELRKEAVHLDFRTACHPVDYGVRPVGQRAEVSPEAGWDDR
jgi:hypothetical protein